jgi:DNA-binding response OmpR family regulator
LRILIVEDEPLIAMMTEDMLTACGHSVSGIAATSDEAIIAIDAGGFDAALLDIRLGEATSTDAADKLRANRIPFLFTTGGPESVAAAYRNVTMLPKPFTMADLEAALETLD